MATIKEVAEKAGVSTATVSRMLNENGFISDDAKRKIKQAMKETGFDPAKRKRRVLAGGGSGLTHNNMLMIWNTGKIHEQTITGQNMMQGITEALQPLGASLTVAHLNGHGEMPPSLETGKLDGIFIHGSSPAPGICKQLHKYPVVWLLKQGSSDFGDRVQPDHALAGELSCDWLNKQGCRNLCCMSYNTTTSRSSYAKTRADHFLSRADRGGIPSKLLIQPEPDDSANIMSERVVAASNLVKQFILLTPKPDGLFVSNELGPYVHAELLKRGIIPMRDLILIAGGEDICAGHHLDPNPATIRIFSPQIGKQAVETLLQRIKNPGMPQITCSLKPELVIPPNRRINLE